MTTRRDFIAEVGAAGVAAGLPFRLVGDPADDPLHIDALCYGSDFSADQVDGAIAGGLSVAVFDIAIYPREPVAASAEMDRWAGRVAAPESRIVLVRNGADVARVRMERKLGVVLACQDASILGAPSADFGTALARFRERGLGMLQLTHNSRTVFADSYMEKRDGGLSRAGGELLAQMNRLGVIVDLSHCSPETLFDAVGASAKPCVVSHGGCRALANTARNKTDAEIRALGKAGGFFGVFNMTCWLTDGPRASIETVIDHIDHALQIIGAPQVGFGSDGALVALDAARETTRMAGVQRNNAGGPSFEWPVRHVRVLELNAPNRLAALGEGLARRGYSAEAIAGVVGGSFLRVLSSVTGT